jgi:glycosyl transferase family 2
MEEGLTIVIPTMSVGMLNATLPAMVVGASGPGQVLIMNGSGETSDAILYELEWLRRSRSDWEFEVFEEVDHLGIVSLMQDGYRKSKYDVVAFLHDDTMVHESGWDEKVRKELDDERVGLIGFGGCSRLALDDIGLPSPAGRMTSNWDDAEFFGRRFSGSCDVAHLDGQSLIAHRRLLENRKDFLSIDVKKQYERYTVYDTWLCCLAKEADLRVRCLGVRSYHLSWLRSALHHHKVLLVGEPEVQQRERRSKGYDFGISRRYLGERFREILPIEVNFENERM